MVSTEAVTLPLDHLLAGASLVPESQRTAFFATLLVGPDALANLTQKATLPATIPTESDVKEGPYSVGLNSQQARKLKEKLDPATWNVIRAAVSNVADGLASVDWSKVKSLTGVPNWTVFAKGRLGGLHRALRNIKGVPSDAVLLWADDDWIEDGKGDYSTGALHIDGPVIHVLRSVMGIADG